MRFTLLPTVLVGLALVAGDAQAQVSYSFTAPSFFDGLSQSWTIVRPGPVATAGFFGWESCSVEAALPEPLQSFACSAEQELNPDGFGTGFAFVSASYEQFLDGLPDGGGTGFFFFEPGAFLADGTYQAVREGIPGFGSAGDATLVVRGISSPVPEPASAGLLLLGALALGVTSRRRQR
jgi:hypothetical protein